LTGRWRGLSASEGAGVKEKPRLERVNKEHKNVVSHRYKNPEARRVGWAGITHRLEVKPKRRRDKEKKRRKTAQETGALKSVVLGYDVDGEKRGKGKVRHKRRGSLAHWRLKERGHVQLR